MLNSICQEHVPLVKRLRKRYQYKLLGKSMGRDIVALRVEDCRLALHA